MSLSKISYNVAEAAAVTGLSASHFSDAIKTGRIKAKTTKARKGESSRNGKRVILAADLERYIAELEDAE